MQVVQIEKKSPQITVVTLNRSERRNSLTIELLNELIAAIRVASDEPRERVLILRGEGAAFCTGLDLKEAADLKKAQMTAELVAKTLITLAETRLVTIAAGHRAPGSGGAGNMVARDLSGSPKKKKIRVPHSLGRFGCGIVMTLFWM